jgi:DNA invertase Pin-like site-specific DNA recombinase
VFNIVHAIAEQGATFRVLDMPALDTADPIAGKIVLNTLALTAELERYFILKRT